MKNATRRRGGQQSSLVAACAGAGDPEPPDDDPATTTTPVAPLLPIRLGLATLISANDQNPCTHGYGCALRPWCASARRLRAALSARFASVALLGVHAARNRSAGQVQPSIRLGSLGDGRTAPPDGCLLPKADEAPFWGCSPLSREPKRTDLAAASVEYLSNARRSWLRWHVCELSPLHLLSVLRAQLPLPRGRPAGAAGRDVFALGGDRALRPARLPRARAGELSSRA